MTSWVQYVRVVRAETLSLRDRDFVQAAIASGAAPARILARYILPNVASSVTVLATFEVARTVILESALSFLGLGAPQNVPSWGSDARRRPPVPRHLVVARNLPGLAISFTVLGVNLFGDGLRDALDPKSR